MSRPQLLFDASALIALARLGLLEAVDQRIGPIHATPEVIAEATVADRPGADIVRRALRSRLVDELAATHISVLSGLGLGESATIRRAATDAMTAVIDDLDARRAAVRLGIPLTGTVALLIRLDRTGGPPISRSLDELDRIGFRVSATLRADAEERGRKTSKR